MEPKKTIAFIIGKLSSGGAERVISTLSNLLVEKYKVVIITTVKHKPFYALDERVKNISCFDQPIPPSKNFIQSLKLNYKISRKVNEVVATEKIDLIIGFITQTNIFAVIAAKKNNIPCIISERTNPVNDNLPRFWKILRKNLYPKANYLVVQTKKVKDYYKEYVQNDKLVVLPNPISKELSQKKVKIKRENIILSVGRLHWIKNQQLIINAFSNVPNKEWKLIVLGEGNEREKLSRIAEQSGLDNVLLPGSAENVDWYYNRAKIFAFTSFFEGFPNALIEAMHFGLAPISTDCPSGPSELINDGDNGFLIDIDDQKALEEKLKLLMGNESLMTEVGFKAMESVEKYNAEKVSMLWDGLISKCWEQ